MTYKRLTKSRPIDVQKLTERVGQERGMFVHYFRCLSEILSRLPDRKYDAVSSPLLHRQWSTRSLTWPPWRQEG